MQLTDKHQQYWRKTLRMTFALLAVWFTVSFVLTYFARDLSFIFAGWPFSFYMAAQGSLIVFVFIIWFYAWRMSQLDDEFGVAEED